MFALKVARPQRRVSRSNSPVVAFSALENQRRVRGAPAGNRALDFTRISTFALGGSHQGKAGCSCRGECASCSESAEARTSPVGDVRDGPQRDGAGHESASASVARNSTRPGWTAEIERFDTKPPPAAVPTAGSSSTATEVPKTGAPKPSSVDVWGLTVDHSMCGCKSQLRGSIAWANEAAATYAGCNTAVNKTGADVEACFNAAQPTSVVVASTDQSGTMALPAPSADPCQRLENKSSFVHETMHSRHADSMARAQSPAFRQAWNNLAGDPQRLDKLRLTFPTETAALDAQWNDGSDWAKDEVHSYTWERRFLTDALAALNQIC